MSAERLLPLYIVPTKQRTFDLIIAKLEKAVVWSFDAAAINQQPYQDENGRGIKYEQVMIFGPGRFCLNPCSRSP